MNKKELISRAAMVLRDKNIRKPMKAKKHTLHISDDYGNKKDFVVKQSARDALYTVEDIEAILDACLYVMTEGIKNGESTVLRGFGELGLKYRLPRATKLPGTGEWVKVNARYVPKFTYGDNLRRAANIYEMSLKDAEYLNPNIEIDDDEDDEDGE